MHLVLLLSLLLTSPLWAQRQIAITIDDLPCAGPCLTLTEASEVTGKVLAALTTRAVPAIGFVNEAQLYRKRGEVDRRIELLERWLAARMELGNHTYSHPDANTTPLVEFEDDVIRGEVVTRQLLRERGQRELYFRFPFTHTGGSAEKKAALAAFLDSRRYRQAPFTVEHEDYTYNAAFVEARRRSDTRTMARIQEAYLTHLDTVMPFVETVSRKLFDREIPQILLIHANALNAECLPVMLEKLATRQYRFVSLSAALADAAYATPDLYTDKYGPSWFHRWGIALHQPFPMRDEPEPPVWVRQLAHEAKRN